MNRLPRSLWTFCFVVTFANCTLTASGADPAKPVLPHHQSKMPGPALTPAEALKKFTVPDGFTVELVASEPELVNPVAMTIDERGRFWITESLEYPRKSAGPGKDRVKILEDTDGDGRIDKVTIFAEGLNIPSGIQVGHGGVWVANSPDLLFYPNADRDGKVDGPPQVIVTGFGRADTHELPNSLTWGPDGYLYGLNGVYNPSVIKQDDREYKFTCALFRIHPQTKRFEVFAEGTSNPWGVAWDVNGSAFVSACVIDHLWHLVETGYYHRQGGPYPPFTWKIDSIVNYKHQMAAYCGIHYFDSDAYPEQYRDRLMMGNIHGNCINVDQVARNGATYKGAPNADILTADDAWFLPIVQKTGPDGCLYILDWYDRYHCYQDANRDPEGVDRTRGRLWRLRYQDTPRAKPFDLAQETDAQLVDRLGSPNVFYRDLAQRILTERQLTSTVQPATVKSLQQLVLYAQANRKQRMHALFTLVSGGPLAADFHEQLLANDDAILRAWGVRAAGNAGKVTDALQKKIIGLAADSSPDVQLQVAIAARKLNGVDPLPVLLEVLLHCGNDPILPNVVWQNLHPLLDKRSAEFLALAKGHDLKQAPALAKIMPKVTEKILTGGKK